MNSELLNSVLQNAVKNQEYSNFTEGGNSCDDKKYSNKNDLARTRKLISIILSKLEYDIENPEFFGAEENKILWGEKENALSLLTKLTQMLLKIIPAENQINESSEEENIGEFCPEDMQILKEYVERFTKE